MPITLIVEENDDTKSLPAHAIQQEQLAAHARELLAAPGRQTRDHAVPCLHDTQTGRDLVTAIAACNEQGYTEFLLARGYIVTRVIAATSTAVSP